MANKRRLEVPAAIRSASHGRKPKAVIRRVKRARFAMCLDNDGYEDLQAWKVYRVESDPKAAQLGCMRVFDESGEDYLYPANRFVAVDFPKGVQARLLRTDRQ